MSPRALAKFSNGSFAPPLYFAVRDQNTALSSLLVEKESGLETQRVERLAFKGSVQEFCGERCPEFLPILLEIGRKRKEEDERKNN